jgi:hypothetical protein
MPSQKKALKMSLQENFENAFAEKSSENVFTRELLKMSSRKKL